MIAFRSSLAGFSFPCANDEKVCKEKNTIADPIKIFVKTTLIIGGDLKSL